jgi:hypothetical protein
MGVHVYCKNMNYFCTYIFWNNVRKTIVDNCIHYLQLPKNYDASDIEFLKNNIDILNKYNLLGVYVLLNKLDCEGSYTWEEVQDILLMISTIQYELEPQLKEIFEYSVKIKSDVFLT